MGEYMTIQMATSTSKRLSPAEFMRRIIGSYAVLQLPGLGYDCFRIWETLLGRSVELYVYDVVIIYYNIQASQYDILLPVYYDYLISH